MGSSHCIPAQSLGRGHAVSHCGNRAPKKKTWGFIGINDTQLSSVRYDNVAKGILDSGQREKPAPAAECACVYMCVCAFVPPDLDNVIKYARRRSAWSGGDRTSLPIRLLVELKELTGSIRGKKAVVHVQSRLECDECGVMLERDNKHCSSNSSSDNTNMCGYPSVDLQLSTWWVWAGSFSPSPWRNSLEWHSEGPLVN